MIVKIGHIFEIIMSLSGVSFKFRFCFDKANLTPDPLKMIVIEIQIPNFSNSVVNLFESEI